MNLKGKRIFLIVILFLTLVFLAIFFWYKNTNKQIVDSEHFVIIDDMRDVILYKNITELKIMDDAVNYYEDKIEEYEAFLPTIDDELLKRDYYNDLALFNNKIGRYQEAYDYYIKSLDINFVNRKTWVSLGDLLVDMKAYKSAERAYLKGNDINPYEQANYVKLANLYMLESRGQEEIVAIYDQGIDLIEKPELLYLSKAEYYEFLQMYKEAIYTYKTWLNIAEEDNKLNIENKILKLEAKL